MVADEGKIILQKSYGVSDIESHTQLKLSDRFYIGSLTKQFTNVLILQLQEDGLININSPVSLFSTGRIYSTAQDLVIWTQALNGNKLLSDKSKKILFQSIHND